MKRLVVLRRDVVCFRGRFGHVVGQTIFLLQIIPLHSLSSRDVVLCTVVLPAPPLSEPWLTSHRPCTVCRL